MNNALAVQKLKTLKKLLHKTRRKRLQFACGKRGQAYLCTIGIEKPLWPFRLTQSYMLLPSNSNTKHKWFLNVKCSVILTKLCESSESCRAARVSQTGSASGIFGKTHGSKNVVQDADFNHGLLIKALLVANNLDSNGLLKLVVVRAHDLAKRTFPQLVQYPEPVRKMVIAHKLEIASGIVVALRDRQKSAPRYSFRPQCESAYHGCWAPTGCP